MTGGMTCKARLTCKAPRMLWTAKKVTNTQSKHTQPSIYTTPAVLVASKGSSRHPPGTNNPPTPNSSTATPIRHIRHTTSMNSTPQSPQYRTSPCSLPSLQPTHPLSSLAHPPNKQGSHPLLSAPHRRCTTHPCTQSGTRVQMHVSAQGTHAHARVPCVLCFSPDLQIRGQDARTPRTRGLHGTRRLNSTSPHGFSPCFVLFVLVVARGSLFF